MLACKHSISREVRGVGVRSTPVVGEALEVLKCEALQILPSDAHDPEPCDGVKQKGSLVRA